MTQLDSPQTVKQKPANNVYTSLILIAFVSLAVAVGVVWWKNVELTGELQPADRSFTNPFWLVDKMK